MYTIYLITMYEHTYIGIASGLTIAGFGSGALVFAPITSKIMHYYAVMPQYLGPTNQFVTKIVDGMC